MTIQIKQLNLDGKITNNMIASGASIDIAKLSQKSVTINGTEVDLGQSLTLDTDDVGEGSTNLYFTDARARSSISTEGSISYNSATGVISFSASDLDTDDIAEGLNNLYYQDQRVWDSLGVASVVGPNVQLAKFDSVTGEFSVELADVFAQFSAGVGLSFSGGEFSLSASTDDVSEGANLYFTDARARDAFTAGTGVTITDGEVSIGQAVGTTSDVQFANMTLGGYLRGPSTFTIDPAAHGDASGTLVIAGNLTVQGTTTTVDSTTVNIGDAILTLNADETGAPSQTAGLEIERGTSDNVQLVFNEGTDEWQFSQYDGSAWNLESLVSLKNFEAGDGISWDGQGQFSANVHTNGGLDIDSTSKGLKVLTANAIQVLNGAIEAKLDGLSLVSSAAGLKINAAGVGTDQLAADAVTDAKIADDAVRKEHLHSDVIKANAGLAQEVDGSLSVSIDNSTIGFNSGALEVKQKSIGSSQMTVEKGANTVVTPPVSGNNYSFVPNPNIAHNGDMAGNPLTMVFLNGVKLFVGTGAATVGSGGVEVTFGNNSGNLEITVLGSILSAGDLIEFIVQA